MRTKSAGGSFWHRFPRAAAWLSRMLRDVHAQHMRTRTRTRTRRSVVAWLSEFGIGHVKSYFSAKGHGRHDVTTLRGGGERRHGYRQMAHVARRWTVATVALAGNARAAALWLARMHGIPESMAADTPHTRATCAVQGVLVRHGPRLHVHHTIARSVHRHVLLRGGRRSST